MPRRLSRADLTSTLPSKIQATIPLPLYPPASRPLLVTPSFWDPEPELFPTFRRELCAAWPADLCARRNIVRHPTPSDNR